MDPKKLFIDDRMKGICAYCGGTPNSRDHVPSKVLLDEPYPKNLPVVESCTSCNQGFSAAEEYIACLIECVMHGTTIPNEKFRPKIFATLNARPSIASRIENGKQADRHGNLFWQPEEGSVKEVVLKLARGHIAYELGIQRIDEPEFIDISPLPSMTKEQLEIFFSLSSSHLYPEIGSRAFVSVLSGKVSAFENWLVVQNGRYQYAIGQSDGDWVKIIINGYLACHVIWD
ncbi:hypothetical protein [Kosakonia sp. 1610]|uniref:hypothetical protein n=1 Tax=Kosakonia sp. 1610 TaxID=3156426 RepID=UPI003D23BEAC